MLFLLSALAAVMLQVAAQTCQLHQSPATFGPWTTCANITDGSVTWTFPAGMQCRNVSYPSTYVRVPDNNATLWTQEKRFVKGTPAAIVYIIADAGQNSDLFALGTLQQIDAALTTNYAVYIPALRGSYHSVVFPDYPTFPVGLWNAIKTPVNGVNYTDLSVTNTAMDLILSIQNAAGQYPKATLNVLAVSYGTVVAQRILAIRPGLLKGAILDSPIPAVNGSNLFYDANNFLDNLSQYMLTNCAKAPVCAGSTLSNAQLVAFINNLKTQTNPCVETFASAIGFVGGSSKKDLLQSLLNAMMNLPNLAIPKYLINGTLLTSTQIQTGFEQAWLDTAALKYPDANKVIVDFRALALALLNQLAQCNYNAPPARITAFNNALLTFKPIVKLVLTAYPVSGVLFAKQQIDRTLLQLSEGRLPAASTNAVLNKTAGSFLVAPPTIFAAEDLLLAETSKIPAFTDCYSNKAPAGVQTKVYFVSGHLDARESFVESQRSYNNLAVAGTGKKTFYISNNAGHGVFTNGFTKCSLILYRGVFLQVSKALNKFAACLNTDNASPVAWSQQLVSSAVGTNSSIWAGLSPSFTGAPTTSPTLAPTNAPTLPTPKPTSPPPSKSPTSASPTKLPTSLAPTTPPPSKSPTSGSPTKLPTSQAPTTTGPTKQPTTAAPTTRGPSAAPTSFKDYCNSFTTSSTCTTAGCVWRSTTKRCTTGSTPSPTA